MQWHGKISSIFLGKMAEFDYLKGKENPEGVQSLLIDAKEECIFLTWRNKW